MTSVSSGPAARPATRPGFVEFVALMALLMGMGAFSIDNLLPAFGPIGADFAIADANQLQFIVYAYMAAFAVTQIVYGPLADVIGRRPVLLTGLLIYSVGSIVAILADSFAMLLVARVIQGIGSAAARVLVVTIVRDRFAGREMARVMSLTMMVFILVPVFAPAVGSLLLLLGSWHVIFIAMLLLGLVVLAWFWLRMPETLHPEYRHPFSFARIGSGIALSITTRASFGYSVAMGLMMGCLMAYIGSAEQILGSEAGVYKLGALFPVAFGVVAGVMGIASLVNSRLVRRLGTRRLSHGAILGFTAVSGLHVALALLFDGVPPLWLFVGLLSLAQFLFSMTMPNFNAMAMEPLGAIAGTASSFIGTFTTVLAVIVGTSIGQSYDGTVLPLALGYFLLGGAAVLVILWTERGRLFRPQHPDPA
ncbi:multidrug effflux MFS transporter [Zavarzinia sp. CC-PAN008]|uniref:multidrug effflux MFS transporter n=1 Tax=Zavarzinia sp. CC-PAN008 TaxID=3243332 RepID=UPI003F745FBB